MGLLGLGIKPFKREEFVIKSEDELDISWHYFGGCIVQPYVSSSLAL